MVYIRPSAGRNLLDNVSVHLTNCVSIHPFSLNKTWKERLFSVINLYSQPPTRYHAGPRRRLYRCRHADHGCCPPGCQVSLLRSH